MKIDYQCAIDRKYDLYASTGVFDDLVEGVKPIVKEVSVFHIMSDRYVGVAQIEIDGEQKLKVIYVTVNEDGIWWEVP